MCLRYELRREHAGLFWTDLRGMSVDAIEVPFMKETRNFNCIHEIL